MNKKFNFNNIYRNDVESIKSLQRQIGVKDDGKIGDKTIKALQRKIGVKDDGIWGDVSKNAANKYFSKNNVPTKTESIKSMVSPRKQQDTSNKTRKGSNFGSILSRAMSMYGTHGIQNSGAQVETSTNKEQASDNTSTNVVSNNDVPSFQQYMYTTGSLGGTTKHTGLGRLSNRLDGYKTGIASMLGIDTNLGEGARRQAVAELTTKGSKGTHYDYDVKYGGANRVGEELKGNATLNGNVVSEKDMRSAQPLRYTVGQNNMFKDSNDRGTNYLGTWYNPETKTYNLRDETDYHMLTIPNEKGELQNVPTKDLEVLPGSAREDFKNFFNGKIGVTTLGENIGTRLGFKGAIRKTTITDDDLKAYKEEYERFKNDPKAQERYWAAVDKYGLKGK